jgi:hypothetical protein
MATEPSDKRDRLIKLAQDNYDHGAMTIVDFLHDPEVEKILGVEPPVSATGASEADEANARWRSECSTPAPAAPVSHVETRRDGHSALRVKDGKLETFDPHPETSPTSSTRRSGHSALRVRDGKLETFDPNPGASTAAVEWQRSLQVLPILPPDAYEGFLAGAAWQAARSATGARSDDLRDYGNLAWTDAIDAAIETVLCCVDPALDGLRVILQGKLTRLKKATTDGGDQNV